MSKAGRPPYEPNEKDRSMVEVMTAGGIPQENIARCVGVDVKTLYKYYREELDTAADKANTVVAKNLFQQATSGNTSAAIWWTKTRMGWKETQVNQVEITDKADILAKARARAANR